MLSGQPYKPWSQELQDDRDKARSLIERYNASLSSDKQLRSGIVAALFGKIDKEHPPYIESPFYCDYVSQCLLHLRLAVQASKCKVSHLAPWVLLLVQGYNISVGKDFYCNFQCALLDGNRIDIGDRVLFGPNVHLYCPSHPLDPAERNGLEGPEIARPIKIGNDVWVGGGAIILPGVTVGDGCTIGAGSVVTHDVESYTVVAGNPARLIRRLEPKGTAEAESAKKCRGHWCNFANVDFGFTRLRGA